MDDLTDGRELLCHPATPARAVRRVQAAIGWRTISALNASISANRELELMFVIHCSPSLLRLPPERPPIRADGLWRATCLEAFLKGENEEYFEFNISPSSEWAAYRFSGYREGQEDLGVPDGPPSARAWRDERYAGFTALIPLGAYTPTHAGLSTVIEERDGTKSYWALAHPDPDKPDFHHPASFVLELPPKP